METATQVITILQQDLDHEMQLLLHNRGLSY